MSCARKRSCARVGFANLADFLERTDAKKTSAVHILRFELSSVQIDALKGGADLAAGIDHENFQVDIRPVAENIRQSLIGDLD